MRIWLFHPIVFYPLAGLLAALVIALSIQPQAWPRPAAPVAGEVDGRFLVLRRAAFDTPRPAPGQYVTVTRNLWGQAQTLRIAQMPSQTPPTPAEAGVQIVLEEAQAAHIRSGAVTVEVSYRPLPVNPASGLAISLQGGGPTTWVSQSAPPQAATLRFNLPAQPGATAIGLRALSEGEDQAYGLEITRIRVSPRATPPPQPAPEAAPQVAPN